MVWFSISAGTLMGLTNCLATIPGFVGPQIVGALTYYEVIYKTQAYFKAFFITMSFISRAIVISS